jgi:hypothetical protein
MRFYMRFYASDPRWTSDDPSVRARIRGRAITAALARLVEQNRRGAYWVDMESVLRGGPVVYAVGQPKAGQPVPAGDLFADPDTALWDVWDRHTPQFAPDHPLDPAP